MRFARLLLARSFLGFTVVSAALSARAQLSVPVVSQSLPAQALAPGGPAATVQLTNHFTVPGVVGARFAQFDTVFGLFNVEMRTDFAPRHVVNFFNYVAAGGYTRTFIHRAASFDGGAVSIVQGGGFSYTVPFQVTTIPKLPPIALEYSLVNARGTLAAARTTDLNSATSEWYFNTRDNSTILNQSNGGGYTVFGRVLGTGMTVVDQIAVVPRYNASGVNSALGEIPLRNSPTSTFNETNLIVINSVREVSLFPSTSGGSAIQFTVQNSAPTVVSTSLAGSALTVTPLAAGAASVTIRASDTNGNSAESTFAVTVTAGLPVFTGQPVSQTVAAGSTVVFGVTARDAGSYQWQRNNVAVTGATNATLVIPNATAVNAGSYRCVSGAATSDAATLAVVNASPSETGRLINLSIRTNAGTGAQTLIVGIAVGGAGTAGGKPLLLRGVGPSLTQFGLTGVLADPVLTVFQGTTAIGANDDWAGDPQILARSAQVGAFNLVTPPLPDSAIATAPPPNSYTAQITGKNNGTGIALAEIYDASTELTATTPRLTNASARTQVGAGGDILIAGFVIGGTTARTVLIRAIGPGLTGFGVTGVLTDPRLQLFRGGGLIHENDNWGGDAQLTSIGTSVGAFGLADPASRDAMLLVTLPPGGYTAQVAGVNGGTGVALVEIYEVP